jgi:hypothetical protein
MVARQSLVRKSRNRRRPVFEALESRLPFNVDFPSNANLIDVAALYGAVPSDGLDDTAAVQQAITDYVARNAILYFRNGVYNFSAPLDYSLAGRGESGIWIQGQSQSETIFRWGNNLPVFNQRDAQSVPINVVALDTYNGNNGNAFGNYLHDFTVEIGAGNPGAVGIQYQTNNYGSLGDVTIRSLDPQKVGARGLDIVFAEPGPMLLTNLTVDGFNQGVLAGPQTYSAVFEGLTLTNQREFGFGNYRLPVSINNFTSINSVPAYVQISSFGWGNSVITNANLSGGNPTRYAIVNENANVNGQGSAGNLTLRNITVSGYAGAVDDQTNATQLAGPIAEYVTFAPLTLVPGSPLQTLDLPIEQTPTLPIDPIANWASVVSFGANPYDDRDDTEAIQRALDSGAKTIYFPNPGQFNRATGVFTTGSYRVEKTLTVGGNVQRVAGLYSSILVRSPLYGTAAPLFSVTDGSRNIVQIDSFVLGNEGGNQGGSWYAFGHDTVTTLVIKDIAGNGYRNSVRGGKVFIEAISGTDFQFDGQKVWLRQINPEGNSDTPKIKNDGGDVWILGLKTEGRSIQVETINGGRTEVLGGNFYNVAYVPSSLPAFKTVDSSLSFSIAETNYIYGGIFNTWVQDTRNGVTRELTRGNAAINGSRNSAADIGLYTDRIVDASAPSVPTSLVGNASINSISLTWNASNENDSFVRAYKVFRDGKLIGATKGTVTTFTDAYRPDGFPGSYQVASENAAGVLSALSPATIISTVADLSPPRVEIAASIPYSNRVTVRFNEPIGAVTTSNFAIDNGVTISAATLSDDRKSVTLVTSPLSGNVQYTVSVNGIRDRANVPNTLVAGTAATLTHRNAGIGTGLTGNYFPSSSFTGTPVVRIDPTIDFNWPGTPGVPGIGADNFSVRWTGQIEPKYSEIYRFIMAGDDGYQLIINGRKVLGRTNYTPDETDGKIALEAGKRYEIEITLYEGAGGAGARLWWESPSQTREIVPSSQLLPSSGGTQFATVRTGVGRGADASYQILDNGVRAEYFANSNLSGTPVLTRNEGRISSFFGSGSPGNGVPTDNFSVRYTGYVLPAFTENYVFTAIADDRVRVYVNDQLVINRSSYSPAPLDSAPIPLTAGVPTIIRYEMEEDGGDATAVLLWRSPSTIEDSPVYLLPTYQDTGSLSTLTTYNRQFFSFFAEFIGLRFDLAGVDLTQRRIVDSQLVATLAGGTGDEIALMTIDGLDDQAPGSDWAESGPNRKRFSTFPGNAGANFSLGGPEGSTHLGYAILDNTNFRTNFAGQDGIGFESSALTQFLQSDTDDLVTLTIRRTVPNFFGNINVFTKEDANPNLAPGLKLALAPNTTNAPLSVDLLSSSDTGSSDIDNITSRNNASPDKALRFRVDGTGVGNLVTL